MIHAVVPLLALVGLLAVAFRHPRRRVELGVAAVAVAATWASGALTGTVAGHELRHLAPVVLFLVAILVVADSCRANGVFEVLGARLSAAGTRRQLFALAFATAAIVTVVLNLDATVVLLTPIVVAAARPRLRVAELACVRLANSASLLLPVSNLTNLLALPSLQIGFGRFALLMTPTWLLVLAIEYLVMRRQVDWPESPAAGEPIPAGPLRWFPIVVVAVMLLGFGIGSIWGVEPGWIAAVAAVVLASHDRALGRRSATAVLDSMHLSFAVFVVALGLVVAALGAGWWGAHLADLVPGGDGLPALLGIAALGALLANLVNNLPATLLLVPLVAPSGDLGLLALLVGINLGSSLTWTGSLANLLWRRTLTRGGLDVNRRAFQLTAFVATPPAILGGVSLLYAWAQVVGVAR